MYQISNVIWVVPNRHWIWHAGEIRRLNPSKQTKSLRSPAHSYKMFWLPMVLYISIFFEAIWFCLPKHRRFPSPLTLNVYFLHLLHVFWATHMIFHLTWHLPYLTSRLSGNHSTTHFSFSTLNITLRVTRLKCHFAYQCDLCMVTLPC